LRTVVPSLIALVVAIMLFVVAVATRSSSSGHSSSSSSGQVASHRTGTRNHGPVQTVSLRVRNATPQPSWKPFSRPVPILVYHDLGTPPASEPYPGLYVSDSDFETEMAWLAQHGYQAVTLDEVMSAWYHGGTLPSEPVVITFDNGYIPQATFAPAVLSKYGWPGVLNEITAGHLNNTRISYLLSLGWEIDSHSINHPDLTAISGSALEYQVVASRSFLRDTFRTFHIPVNSFCYPSSKYNAAVIAAVKAAGYTNATTENSGYATSADPYLLNRFEIEGGLSQLQSDLAQGP
jgi:peptidoglycan/xylan/chitin deacetylase (PgdA/CDA1 family)